MNILFVTQLYSYKKESKFVSSALREFVECWGQSGHKIHVIRPYFKYEEEELPKDSNFEIGDNISVEYIRPIRIPLLKASFYSNKNIVSNLRFKPDIVVCHLYNSYLPFRNLAKKLKVPLVIGIHMSDINMAASIFYRWRQKRVFNKSDAFVMRSYAIKKLFNNYFPEYIENSFVALSGIPDPFIQNALNLNIQNRTDAIKIISVCKLIKLKNLDKVLIALSKLDPKIDWSYTIVGDGPEKETLKKIAVKQGIMNRIWFTGNVLRDRVLQLLNEHEIFVMPSYPETLGLAYLEAMACGNLVIGTKGWGIDGVVKDNENGYLCDSTKIVSIKDKLGAAIDEVRKEDSIVRKNSLKTILSFSMEERANYYISNLEKVVGK